jgi:hypothetical protein
MTQDKPSTRPDCFVEFRVLDKERFDILRRFFEPLRAWTRHQDADAALSPISTQTMRALGFDQTQEYPALASRDETVQRSDFARPEEWLLSLRPADMVTLQMPTHAEAIKALREWQGLARRERRTLINSRENSKQLRVLADFMDMLECWKDVQYELVSLEMSDSDLGRIIYSTFDFPFEGKSAIEEMLMFFGFFSIVKDPC